MYLFYTWRMLHYLYILLLLYYVLVGPIGLYKHDDNINNIYTGRYRYKL